MGGSVWDNRVSLRSYLQLWVMKYLKKIVIILLNVLFCAVTIWVYSRNSILRPFAGSYFKETLSATLLLVSLYANYFLLYPQVHQKQPEIIYWMSVVFMSIAVAATDLAIAYPFIMTMNGRLVEHIGFYKFFGGFVFFISVRNLALNLFPFLFRERQQYRQLLEKEVQIIYRDVRKVDVTDKDSNVHLVDINDIFYCRQQGNFTSVITVQNEAYTRLGSMKHLEQLFGAEEFIRISPTLLVPFRYIQSCENNVLIMKKMPLEKEPTTFKLELKTGVEIAEKVSAGLLRHHAETDGNENSREQIPAVKRKPAIPPEEKVQEVLSYIEAHPNCNTADIVAETDFSLSTVERCLAELKKRGAIQYTGSKKTGGYKKV